MNKQNEKIMLIKQGNVTKSLFKLGIPMIITMLVTALYNVVDTYFVSSLGLQQSGAVSVAFPLSLYFSGLGLTFGVGAGSYISRLLGSKQHKKANQVGATAFYTVIILSALMAIVSLLNLKGILKFMGATSTIMPYSLQYAKVFVISTLFSAINIAIGNIAIAQGASNITLKAMISGAVLNMILDPLLIYGLHMGIQGAAIATLISQIVTLIIYLTFFFLAQNYLDLGLKMFKPQVSIYAQIIKIGLSMLLLQVLAGVSMSLIIQKASIYGDAAVAALGIVLRVVTLGTNVVFGFMKGYQPIVGYNYGAKNYQRIIDTTKVAIKWSTVYCMLWTIIVMIFSEQIIGLLINDSEVIKIGARALKVNSLMFVSFGFQFTYATLYLSIGKALAGGFLNIGRQGFILIPVILIMSNMYKLNGVIFAQSVTDVILTLITVYFAAKINRILKSKQDDIKTSSVSC
ncbi:MATE family efflux transporter [Clostridium sp. 'deep sea']|uniref:MATE family efflux transporter n=1 Tax=Clostridium sp. 'deep sea' TaxID=2779445 RepID=UPI0018968E1D|nr:MATE family efflux transporter [Clostridium sp. 'deep sea']QOR36296.1 MATE family efflux transporter [Clostridium sp. 'deep sea']